MHNTPREIRQAAGATQLEVAAGSKCSITLVRLHEANANDGVKDPRKRAALVAFYTALAARIPTAQAA